MTTTVMPAAFIGHGTPMNALEHNRYTETWRAFGAIVPRPRAILVVSAHWYINATAVTAMAQPETIHDFYGFPPRVVRGRVPGAGRPGAGRRDRRGRRARRGSASTTTAGASTTAPGRCSCTRSPTPTSPCCSWRSTRRSRSTTTSRSGAGSRRCASGRADRRQRQRRAQPRPARLRGRATTGSTGRSVRRRRRSD